jgi:hypothetical protein
VLGLAAGANAGAAQVTVRQRATRHTAKLSELRVGGWGD